MISKQFEIFIIQQIRELKVNFVYFITQEIYDKNIKMSK